MMNEPIVEQNSVAVSHKNLLKKTTISRGCASQHTEVALLTEHLEAII